MHFFQFFVKRCKKIENLTVSLIGLILKDFNDLGRFRYLNTFLHNPIYHILPQENFDFSRMGPYMDHKA